MNIEIERRFLLKTIDEIELGTLCNYDIKTIIQFYHLVNGQTVRYRQVSPNYGEKKYYQTIKKKIDTFTFEEDEKEISFLEFTKSIASQTENQKVIVKRRFNYYDEKQNLKFEVDVYSNLNLIILEVELPTKETKFEIPKIISDNIIIEVTGISQFSNAELSIETAGRGFF